MSPYWKEKHSINHSIIDKHRKDILTLIYRLEILSIKNTPKDTYKTLLNNLYSMLTNLFEEEKEYLEGIDFPELNQHVEEHRSIIEQFHETLKSFKTLSHLHSALLLLCKSRIAHHITSSDPHILTWQKEYTKRSRQNDDSDLSSIA